MTARRLLYATQNPGKLAEVRALLARYGLAVSGPESLGLTLEVDEHGATLEANAALKARAYREALAARGDQDTVVLGDDTGVEIDALGGEPGIHVRRWDGSARMSDEAILRLCLDRLRGVPPGQRGAQFRTVFALAAADPDSDRGESLDYFEGTLRGVILEQPDPLRIEGFPFESIFFVPEWDLLLGKVHQLPDREKARYITHRERALHPALPRLRQLLAR